MVPLGKPVSLYPPLLAPLTRSTVSTLKTTRSSVDLTESGPTNNEESARVSQTSRKIDRLCTTMRLVKRSVGTHVSLRHGPRVVTIYTVSSHRPLLGGTGIDPRRRSALTPPSVCRRHTRVWLGQKGEGGGWNRN